MTDSGTYRSRRRLVVAAAVLVGAVMMLVVMEWGAWLGVRDAAGPGADDMAPFPTMRPEPAPASTAAESGTPGVTGGPTPVRAFGVAPIPPPQPEGQRSPLADRLNDPSRTARDDVTIVAELLANYLGVFRKLPVGTNAEITAALAGDNPRGLVPLPPDNAAISAGGELVDRWGTPYFFHHVSRDLMEIRAAGPDRRHFTADDIVWPEAENATIAQAPSVP